MSSDPRWDEVFAQSGVAQAIVSPHGRIVAVNEATCAMFAREPAEIIGEPLLPKIPAQWRDDDAQLLKNVLDGTLPGAHFERTLPHRDGGVVKALVSVTGVRVDGVVSELSVCLQDISALKEAQFIAERAEARWRSLSQNASDVALITDADLVVGYVSPAMTAMLGHAESAVLGSSLLELAHTEDRARLRAAMRRLVATSRSEATLHFRVRDALGGWRYVEHRVVNLLGDPHVGGLVVNLRDRTAQHELETSLRRASLEDPLTGLPNRALIMDRIQQAIEREQSGGHRCALLFVNIDKLKAINDVYGQDTGDLVLRRVADTLSALVGPSDTVGRYGSDEFVVLLDDIEDQDPDSIATRVALGLTMPVERECGTELHVSACVGLAHGPSGTAEGLVSAAEAALMTAKRLGRGRVSVMEDELLGRIETSRELSAELSSALAEHQLVVHFQPLVNLKTGSVRCFEALVRWEHPRLGLLGPDAFLPLAEALDLQVAIDEWVLREACLCARAWSFLGAPVSVAVNVAPTHLTSAGFTENVREALSISGLPAEQLVLEITETAVVSDVEAAQRVLAELGGLGVRVSIDDFGTGYSSMLQLRQLPFSELKIDREFVRGLPDSQDDAAICGSVIDLAQRLGVRVIGEGIETPEQAAALAAMGCHVGQGFLWSPPVDAAGARALLAGPAWTPSPERPRRVRTRSSPEESPAAVARAGQLHESGASLHTVAAALNREGLRTHAGRRWTPASVARLLVTP